MATSTSPLDDPRELPSPPPQVGRFALAAYKPGEDLLDRLEALLGERQAAGAWVVIIAPKGQPEVFVQCIVTEVGVHLEAVSNTYLTGTPWALTHAQHDHLARLGWTPPNLAEDPSQRPLDWDDDPDIARHWWQDVGGADATARSACLLLSTLIEVYRPGEVLLEVETFPAACQVWVWEDGVLEALDT